MSKKNGSVLVVDDDAEINSLVGAYAQLCGLEYRRALDGAQALREAKARSPAVVVLDLMLPDADGYQICRTLKSNPTTADVPIIILTALDGEEDRKKGQACGASEYLTKPFNPDTLMASITRLAK